MHKTGILFLLLISTFCKAQLVETFSDGNFTANPTWVGDTSLFDVVGDSLHSNSTALSSSFYLSTYSSKAKNTQWEFSVRLAFSTSGSNYVDVFLMSDTSNLLATKNGYFVRIGNTKDEVSLYKIDAGITSPIIDGADNSVSSSDNKVRIIVTRDSANVWKLKHELNGDGTNFFTESTVVDSSISASKAFGFLIKQSTASFFKKHWFDSIIIGDIVYDKTSPSALSAVIISNAQLDVYFSENVDLVSAKNSINYSVNNSIGFPSSASVDVTNGSLVHLLFGASLVNGLENTITINNVLDNSSNAIKPNSTLSFYNPKQYELVINEIMADPTPVIGLPDAEYVELYNKSDASINLQGFSLVIGSSVKILPHYSLKPKEYVVLVNENDAAKYGNTQNAISPIGLSSSSLTNTGTSLIIKNTLGDTIHQLTYSDNWYNSSYKANGGWSLEQIDPLNPCGAQDNWKASISVNGGTPGKINSVFANNPDTKFPELLRALAVDSNKLRLFFSERLNKKSVRVISNFSVNNSVGTPESLKIVGINESDVLLTFNTNFQLKKNYSVTVKNTISDCVGNTLNETSTVDFALSEPADTNDVLINEILYNPQTDGVDFVEIYNNSDKVIDLNSLRISNIDTTTLALSTVYQIDTIGYLIFPRNYYVLTENPEDIKARYTVENTQHFVHVDNLPTLSITSGSLAISKTNLRLIDYTFYTDAMQFPLLTSSKGVSLERISLTRKSTDKGNWHSASETAGFATPTAKNSQYNSEQTSDEFITFSKEIFSPDNDGYEDVLQISLNEKVQGSVSSISVYNQRGVFIKQLANNLLLGTSTNVISWDGTNANNEKTEIGIYLIVVSTFETNGSTKQYKKPVVVAGKL